MTPDQPRHFAVLIDSDNVPAKYAAAIFSEIASFGEASIRRLYGDFSGNIPQGWSRELLADLGIVPHQQFANTRGKNASDIALVIDAMDILHGGRFDGFVIVSSDGDFTRLASRIREQGLDVVGMGEQKTPKSFVATCKRFIYLENLIEEPEPAPEKAAEKKLPAAQSKKPPPSQAVPLILKALKSVDADSEWIGLGQLGKVLIANNPEFDARNYSGTDKLSALLEKSGHFELKAGPGNGLIVRVKPSQKKKKTPPKS